MDSEWIQAALGSAKMVRRFEQGELIFREGEMPLGIYIVHDGAVDLSFPARIGKTRPSRAAERGEILGLSAVTTQHGHECSATARSTCEIGFIDRHDFLRALEDTPAAWFVVLHFLSREVNAAYDEIRKLAGGPHERTPAGFRLQ